MEEKGPKSQVPLCHSQLLGQRVKTERMKGISQRCWDLKWSLKHRIGPQQGYKKVTWYSHPCWHHGRKSTRTFQGGELASNIKIMFCIQIKTVKKILCPSRHLFWQNLKIFFYFSWGIRKLPAVAEKSGELLLKMESSRMHIKLI